MALQDLNFSLDIWQNPDETIVFVRLQHNVENGSSVGSQGSSLSEALINLGEHIRKGCHPVLADIDPVWGDPIVCGEQDGGSMTMIPIFTRGLYIEHLTMLILYAQSGRSWNTTGVADRSHVEAILAEMELDIPIEYQP